MGELTELVKKTIYNAEEYAARRKIAVRNGLANKNLKKITPALLKDEVEVARVIGEMTVCENLYIFLQDNKDMTTEDLLDSIVITLEEYSDYISGYLEGKKVFNKEDIIKSLTINLKEKNDGIEGN